MVTLTCQQCGQAYERTQRRISGVPRRYCSRQCYAQARERPLDTFYMPEPNTGCWLWLGPMTGGAYPYPQIKRMAINGRVPVGAHRYFYEREHGSIPAGMTVDHRCNVPSCVNPAHLQVATLSANIRRARLREAALREAALREAAP